MLLIELIIGVVKVLLVRVSVVARPTKVSVDVGNVNVPVLLIELIIGVVKVLLVSVAVPVFVTKPPEPELTAIPKAVITPVPVVVVDGATPAPPPITRALAANTPDEAQVVPDEK